jgi:hypothetical protein
MSGVDGILLQTLRALLVLRAANGSPAGDYQLVVNGSGVVTGISGPGGVATLGGSVASDGDYGDITISGAGTVISIDAKAVTLAKMADIATASIMGRVTAGAGTPEVLTAAQVRTLLGLVIGTNVQAQDADLDAIAALTVTNDDVLQRKAGAWVNRTMSQLAVDLFGDGTDTNQLATRIIPQVSFSAATALIAAHSGKELFHPASDVTARTVTIPSNAGLALPIGFTTTITNEDGAGVVNIAITADTLYWSGNGGTGTRALAAGGWCTISKKTATKWFISGTNLT